MTIEADVIRVHGDAVGTPLVRDGSGAARAAIRVDCRTLQEQEFNRPTFTTITVRALRSVRIELAAQNLPATRLDGDERQATFGVSVDVSAVAGTVTGQVVAAGVQTQTRITDRDQTTTTSPWRTAVPFVATVVADTTPPTIQLVAIDAQTGDEAGQTLHLDITDGQSGLRTTTWEIPGSGRHALEADGGRFRARVDWRTATNNPGTAPAEVPVQVRARDTAAPNGNEAVADFVLRDAVPPTLTVDVELTDDGTATRATCRGTAADGWSGVAQLALAVDDGSPVDLRPGQPPVATTEWSHTVVLPDFRHHRILVRARDAAGNETVLTRTVAAELLGPGRWLDVGAPPTGDAVEVLGLLDLWDHPALPGLHLAVRATDNRLWTAAFDGRGWQWTDHHAGLGPTAAPVLARGVGTFVDNPAAPVPFVAVQSVQGRLWIRWYSGAAWQWTDRGRPPGTPITAPVGLDATAADNGPTVVVQGEDRQLWAQRWASNWVAVPAPASQVSGPVLIGVTRTGAAFAEQLVATVGSEDGHAWSVRPDGTGWTDLGAPDRQVTVSAPVGTARSGDDSYRAFVTGSDGDLWVVAAAGPARWTDLGAPPGAGIAFGAGVRPGRSAERLSIAHLVDTDGRLWAVGWAGSGPDWQDRGAPTTPLAVRATPTALAAGARLGSGMPARNLVLACTTDGHVWLHRSLDG